MALPDWVPIAGVVSSLTVAIVAAFRVRPEARKWHNEGAAAVASSGAAIAASVQQDLQSLRNEVAELNKWRRRKEHLDRVHGRWDDQMVNSMRALGQTVDDPPPLYVDD